MFKFIGSSLALAVGAGALYCWWKHEHNELEDSLKHTGRDMRHTLGDVSE